MIEVHRLPQFDVLYDLPKDIHLVCLIGGRGGAKTYEASKMVAFNATIKKKRAVILRDEHSLVRETILNEILLRYDTANENGVLDQYYEKLDTGIKNRETGEMAVFTQGFRASSLAKSANLKGFSNIDIAVVEELEDIRDQQKFNTFSDSIRKEGSVIIVILNTPDIHHWLIKTYFHLEPARDDAGNLLDGFFKIIPKNIPGFLCIQTGYEANPHLAKHIVKKYQSYGDPESPLYDAYYYYSAIKGYASTGRKGQIFTKVKRITLAEYLALPYKEHYGQDFGTASPAGTVGCKKHRNKFYSREINYLPMETLDIGRMYCRLKFRASDMIVADSADQKAITKLRNGWQGHELSAEDFTLYPGLAHGWHIVDARKGQDSITYGIDLLKSYDWYVVEESENYWNEIYNYVYDKDKNENYTNDPIDDYNHLIDPTRYVAEALDIGTENW